MVLICSFLARKAIAKLCLETKADPSCTSPRSSPTRLPLLYVCPIKYIVNPLFVGLPLHWDNLWAKPAYQAAAELSRAWATTVPFLASGRRYYPNRCEVEYVVLWAFVVALFVYMSEFCSALTYYRSFSEDSFHLIDTDISIVWAHEFETSIQSRNEIKRKYLFQIFSSLHSAQL